MQARYDIAPKRPVQRCRRHAFIAAAVERQAGVAAYPAHPVFRVRKEHPFVVRVGTVAGVGEPEILPHGHSVAVAGVVELLVADLSHPVAYHAEIHASVVIEGDVVLLSRKHQVVLGEAPVSALGHEPAAVDEQLQGAVAAVPGHLPYAGLEVQGIRKHAVDADGESCIMQHWLPVSHRPPEVKAAVAQLREIGGRK